MQARHGGPDSQGTTEAERFRRATIAMPQYTNYALAVRRRAQPPTAATSKSLLQGARPPTRPVEQGCSSRESWWRYRASRLPERTPFKRLLVRHKIEPASSYGRPQRPQTLQIPQTYGRPPLRPIAKTPMCCAIEVTRRTQGLGALGPARARTIRPRASKVPQTNLLLLRTR